MKQSIRLLASLMLITCFFAGNAHSAPQTLRVLNWGEYIDPDVLKEFEQANNVTIEYAEFNSVDEFSEMFFNPNNKYDVIFPASAMIRIMAENDLIIPLDKKRFTNFSSLNSVVMQGLELLDNGNVYSIPYMWGTTGIGLNVNAVKKLGIDPGNHSWGLLFDSAYRKKLKQCGIGLVNERDEIFAAALKYLGYSVNTSSKAELEAAGLLLKETIADINYLHTTQYTDDLKDNKICLGVGYSGDILTEVAENQNLEYIIPKEGAAMWIDIMAIPKNAPNQDLAYTFIDYMMSAKVSARNSNYTAYPTPMLDAQQFVDSEILNDPTIYPNAQTLASLQMMAPKERKTNRIKHRLWVKAICQNGKWCSVPMQSMF
ncbi:MAG: extracellular solute-binding protein [Gammaproteobacteria bacterium]|nr:extracellular solute-binding protein [Gammaproteobacteria bacterium]